MDPLMGYLGLLGVVILVFLGMRIAYAAAFVGFCGLVSLKGLSVSGKTLGFLIHGIVAHYSLSVVPLFIVMGYFSLYGGLTDDLFDTARNWLGNISGGIAIATIGGCAAFAACTGASTASAAIFGRIAVPEMIRSGYSNRMSTALVAASGTLASLIPPSVILVIYAIITGQSVRLLLVAGFIPGVLSALIYAGMIYTRVKFSREKVKHISNITWEKRFKSLKGMWWVVALFIIVLGGLYIGVFTPTEAGGVGAFGAFVLGIINKKLSLTNLKKSLLETGRTTIMVFSIIVGVLILVRFLALSGFTAQASNFVAELPIPRIGILLSVLSLYLFLGMFLDAIGMLMLTLPIIYPAIILLGFDPIWFGIILVKMIEISLITPPVGINVYVVHSVVPDIAPEEIFRGVLPFLAMDILTVSLLIMFPQIVTFLPYSMKITG